MRNKRRVILALILLTIVAACVVTGSTEEAEQCRIEALALEKEMLPADWEHTGISPVFLSAQYTPDAREGYRVSLEKGDSVIYCRAYRYSNRWQAAFYLWFDRETFFPSRGWSWAKMAEFDDLPLSSSQGRIRCGTERLDSLHRDELWCGAVLRDGAYVSTLYMDIGGEGGMSTEDFMRLVIESDRLLSSCGE